VKRTPAELLWDLPGTDDGPAPPDDVLRAYRSGSLTPAEAERVEWMLTRSAEGRARLAELGGVRLPSVPNRLRRQIVGDVPALRPWLTLDWRWAVAVLAVAVVAFALLFLPRSPGTRAPVPPFDVRVLGLADTRSAPGTARARPETPVTIVIEAEGPTTQGLVYAVYRLRDDRLERLAPGEVAVETHRGGAVLKASGESLAGRVPGEHELFVAIAPGERLPEQLVVGPEQDPAARLAEACAGRVLKRRLTIEPIEDKP
jgi:hypothetical protein